jgi:hypothetical protein
MGHHVSLVLAGIARDDEAIAAVASASGAELEPPALATQ